MLVDVSILCDSLLLIYFSQAPRLVWCVLVEDVLPGVTFMLFAARFESASRGAADPSMPMMLSSAESTAIKSKWGSSFQIEVKLCGAQEYSKL